MSSPMPNGQRSRNSEIVSRVKQEKALLKEAMDMSSTLGMSRGSELVDQVMAENQRLRSELEIMEGELQQALTWERSKRVLEQARSSRIQNERDAAMAAEETMRMEKYELQIMIDAMKSRESKMTEEKICQMSGGLEEERHKRIEAESDGERLRRVVEELTANMVEAQQFKTHANNEINALSASLAEEVTRNAALSSETAAWKQEVSKEREVHDNVTVLNSKMITQMERQKVLHEQVMIGIRDEKIRVEENLRKEMQRLAEEHEQKMAEVRGEQEELNKLLLEAVADKQMYVRAAEAAMSAKVENLRATVEELRSSKMAMKTSSTELQVLNASLLSLASEQEAELVSLNDRLAGALSEAKQLEMDKRQMHFEISEHEGLRAKVGELQSTVAEVTKENIRLNESLTGAFSKTVKLEVAKKALEQAGYQHETFKADVEAQLKARAAETGNVKAELEALVESLSEAQARVVALEADKRLLEKAVAEHDEELLQAQSLEGIQAAKVAELRGDVGRLRAEADSLQQSVKMAELRSSDYDKLQAAFDQAKAELEEVKRLGEMAQKEGIQQLATLRIEVSALNMETSQVSDKLEMATAKIESLEREAEQAAQKLQQAQGAVEEKEKDVSKAKERINELDRTVLKLRCQQTESTLKIDAVHESEALHRDASEQLKREVAGLEVRLEEATKAKERQEELALQSVEALRGTIQELQQRVVALQEEGEYKSEQLRSGEASHAALVESKSVETDRAVGEMRAIVQRKDSECKDLQRKNKTLQDLLSSRTEHLEKVNALLQGKEDDLWAATSKLQVMRDSHASELRDVSQKTAADAVEMMRLRAQLDAMKASSEAKQNYFDVEMSSIRESHIDVLSKMESEVNQHMAEHEAAHAEAASRLQRAEEDKEKLAAQHAKALSELEERLAVEMQRVVEQQATSSSKEVHAIRESKDARIAQLSGEVEAKSERLNAALEEVARVEAKVHSLEAAMVIKTEELGNIRSSLEQQVDSERAALSMEMSNMKKSVLMATRLVGDRDMEILELKARVSALLGHADKVAADHAAAALQVEELSAQAAEAASRFEAEMSVQREAVSDLSNELAMFDERSKADADDAEAMWQARAAAELEACEAKWKQMVAEQDRVLEEMMGTMVGEEKGRKPQDATKWLVERDATVKELKQTLLAMSNMKDKCVAEVVDMAERIKKMESQRNVTAQETGMLRQALTTIDAQGKGKDSTIKELQQRVADGEKGLLEKEGELQDIRQRLAEGQKKMDEAASEVADLRSAVLEQGSQIDALTATCKQCHEEASAAKAKCGSVDELLSESQAKVVGLKDLLQIRGEECSRKESEVKRLEEAVASAHALLLSRGETHAVQAVSMAAEVKGLEQKVSALCEELASAKKVASSYQDTCAKLEKGMMDKGKAGTEIQASALRAKGALITELGHKISTLLMDKTAVEAKALALAGEVDGAMREAASLEKLLRGEITSLEAQLEGERESVSKQWREVKQMMQQEYLQDMDTQATKDGKAGEMRKLLEARAEAMIIDIKANALFAASKEADVNEMQSDATRNSDMFEELSRQVYTKDAMLALQAIQIDVGARRFTAAEDEVAELKLKLTSERGSEGGGSRRSEGDSKAYADIKAENGKLKEKLRKALDEFSSYVSEVQDAQNAIVANQAEIDEFKKQVESLKFLLQRSIAETEELRSLTAASALPAPAQGGVRGGGGVNPSPADSLSPNTAADSAILLHIGASCAVLIDCLDLVAVVCGKELLIQVAGAKGDAWSLMCRMEGVSVDVEELVAELRGVTEGLYRVMKSQRGSLENGLSKHIMSGMAQDSRTSTSILKSAASEEEGGAAGTNPTNAQLEVLQWQVSDMMAALEAIKSVDQETTRTLEATWQSRVAQLREHLEERTSRMKAEIVKRDFSLLKVQRELLESNAKLRRAEDALDMHFSAEAGLSI